MPIDLCDLPGRTVVVFGGRSLSHPSFGRFLRDAWALDASSGSWYQAAHGIRGPAARMFNADAAGGAVLKDGGGQEWLCIFGGKCQPGYRDNETWILGPLGPACTASSWVWRHVQADDRIQSHLRPEARFHHTLTRVDLSQRLSTDACRGQHLVVLGGHDRTISAIASMWILSLSNIILGRCRRCDADADGHSGTCPRLTCPRVLRGQLHACTCVEVMSRD